jgi:hydrogenase maturation protein HypF
MGFAILTSFSMRCRAKISVSGIVQGVGFRPFIHRLAKRFRLCGWVQNSTTGVLIEVEGDKKDIERFFKEISSSAPPLADIQRKQIRFGKPKGLKTFQIKESLREKEEFVLLSPDISICKDCYRELNDKNDRRFCYPFINCTNCGPRFTIIKNIPYDRINTTMAEFKMCVQCESEYKDITNRRYHAEPNACEICGPVVWLEDSQGVIAKGREAITQTIKLLKEGKIVAIKGIGGFHLACDATNPDAVKLLKIRKERERDKPLAIMSKNLQRVKQYCRVNKKEQQLLESPQRPIVLLERIDRKYIVEDVAPNNKYLGVMLPYTPLHYLLFSDDSVLALVMTSGNTSEEPIVKDNRGAKEQLAHIADFFLMHNRDIFSRCDDSVARLVDKKITLIRRSRGYTPFPVLFRDKMPQILACGAELKNTFCLTKGRHAFLSQHMGDLKNWETFRYYKSAIQHFKRMFRIKPEIIAHDLHPDYLSTRYAIEEAEREGLRRVGVQHHHAHIVSCLAENQVKARVIGVSFDGTGYGSDGNIWGGEFLVANTRDFKRVGHLKYLPLPAGDTGIREPWRMTISYLYYVYGDDLLKMDLEFVKRIERHKVELVIEMIKKKINCPLTSSCGRFFDAISSLIGVCDYATYEGQSACELEMHAHMANHAQHYSYEIKKEEGFIVDPRSIVAGVVDDIKNGVLRSQIALKFHNTVANFIVDMCLEIRKQYMINKVALSGGVFQNKLLTERVSRLLKNRGFLCYLHSRVPPNDGGISLGQAIVAACEVYQM